EPSGMLMFEVPVLQVPDPLALVVTRLTTQVLVAGLLPFGIGRGAPKRHPVNPGYSGLTTPAEVQKRFSWPAGTPRLPVTCGLAGLGGGVGGRGRREAEGAGGGVAARDLGEGGALIGDDRGQRDAAPRTAEVEAAGRQAQQRRATVVLHRAGHGAAARRAGRELQLRRRAAVAAERRAGRARGAGGGRRARRGR